MKRNIANKPSEINPSSQSPVPVVTLSPLRLFVGLVAVLMVFIGILWLGEVFGLLAALIPGGLQVFQGFVWGVVGLAGLVVLFLLYLFARNVKKD